MSWLIAAEGYGQRYKNRFPKKFDWESLGCSGHVTNMFKVAVKIELDTDFTLAEESLPNYLMAKLKVSHNTGGNDYMVCQVILTQEMTREDLIKIVTLIRTWMDGKDPNQDYKEQKERKALCQNSKSPLNEKTTLISESKDL